MRFSEAIRLGATMTRQAFGVGSTPDKSATCAIGAAWDAVGLLDSDGLSHKGCTFPWPEAISIKVNCPATGCVRHEGLLIAVIHLNDDHYWTRERIADWVELHEPVPLPELTDDRAVIWVEAHS